MIIENLYMISKLESCGRFKDSNIEIIKDKEPKGFFYEKEILMQAYGDYSNIEEHINLNLADIKVFERTYLLEKMHQKQASIEKKVNRIQKHLALLEQ